MKTRLINTNKEMQELTGSWYENNKFERLHTDIDLETESLSELIGDRVISKTLDIYNKDDSERSSEEKILLRKVQLPIAFMSLYQYNQGNLVAHENTSRVVKIDKQNEVLPWEWMLDRDDRAQINKAQRTTDSLIKYLEKENVEEWLTSDQYKNIKSLFVNNLSVFERYYPIDNSSRFYVTAAPFLREIQITKIQDALGDDFEPTLEEFQTGAISDKHLYDMICRAQVTYCIALAVRRLPMQVMPEGLLRKIKSSSQTLNAAGPSELDIVTRFSYHLEIDAENHLDEIKKYRYKNSPEYLEQTFLPKNDPKNKYART